MVQNCLFYSGSTHKDEIDAQVPHKCASRFLTSRGGSGGDTGGLTAGGVGVVGTGFGVTPGSAAGVIVGSALGGALGDEGADSSGGNPS